jgi:hypothetical protein
VPAAGRMDVPFHVAMDHSKKPVKVRMHGKPAVLNNNARLAGVWVLSRALFPYSGRCAAPLYTQQWRCQAYSVERPKGSRIGDEKN